MSFDIIFTIIYKTYWNIIAMNVMDALIIILSTSENVGPMNKERGDKEFEYDKSILIK